MCCIAFLESRWYILSWLRVNGYNWMEEVHYGMLLLIFLIVDFIMSLEGLMNSPNMKERCCGSSVGLAFIYLHWPTAFYTVHGSFYVNDCNSDGDFVFLMIAGKRFYAHRIALLASSDAFRAMFDGGYRVQLLFNLDTIDFLSCSPQLDWYLYNVWKSSTVTWMCVIILVLTFFSFRKRKRWISRFRTLVGRCSSWWWGRSF